MGVGFLLIYHKKVLEEDIPKLSSVWKKKIKKAVEEKLLTQPETYGKPLRRSLKGYRKLRVADYRVVFRIEEKTVKVLAILHRSEVYKQTAIRAQNGK
ncbi:MAG: type II toxin-antitoxin system RelE/ParE family toxin [Patescibacteria group bacterium]